MQCVDKLTDITAAWVLTGWIILGRYLAYVCFIFFMYKIKLMLPSTSEGFVKAKWSSMRPVLETALSMCNNSSCSRICSLLWCMALKLWKMHRLGWREGSAVGSEHCSYRGPEAYLRQLLVTDPTPPVCTMYTYWQTDRYN